MGFKEREYNFYKKLCKWAIRNVPPAQLYDCDPVKFSPPSVLLGMLPDFIEEQNFEACKAIEDTIREWFVERSVDIPADATLKIPPKSEDEIHGLISLGDPNDPYGLASGGAISF